MSKSMEMMHTRKQIYEPRMDELLVGLLIRIPSLPLTLVLPMAFYSVPTA